MDDVVSKLDKIIELLEDIRNNTRASASEKIDTEEINKKIGDIRVAEAVKETDE